MIGEFRRIGDMAFLSHIVDASSGNLSVRTKNGVWITKTNRSLYNLRGKDIVKIGFKKDRGWDAASSEVDIHINLYKSVDSAKAIVHTHPPYTITLSLKEKSIEPIDYEGKLFLRHIDVLDIPYNRWSDAKDIIPDYFANSKNKIVIAKGHGVFAYSDTLFAAYQITSALESSAKILSFMKQLQ